MDVIALVVGELTALLTVDKDNYKRGIQDAKSDLNNLARDADRQSNDISARSGRIVTAVGSAMATATRNADRQGNEAGGKLAQGINQGIIRNSPLIVAGVSAALAAGAPVMLASATTLFAGVGAVAAAQTVAVRSAWTSLGKSIRDGAVSDAAVLVPVYVRMADTIGAAFQRMRPQLRDAFTAAGPQIDSFTNSLVKMAENAMPGLVRAVQGAGPVIEGLGKFLESVGSGLTAFFDKLTAHAPAAGAAFSAIGRIMEALLPILGELLGQGAELASMVLPPLASALGVVAKALGGLGPLLPIIATGFAAFKIVSTLTGPLASFGAHLSSLAAQNLPGISTAAGGAASAIGTFGKAIPVIGVAVGVVSAALLDHKRNIDQWARALLEGGAAAAAARKDIADVSPWERFTNSLSNMTTGIGAGARASREAKAEMDSLLSSMDPVNRSAALLTQAENDLSFALEQHGAGSAEVAAAQGAYDAALANSEAANAELEMAIDGVTAAMIGQAEQALAAANADFAYRDAKQDLAEQITATNTIMNDGSSTAADMSGAMLNLEKDTLAVAEAAGRLASDALPAGTSELEKQQVAASATLTELVRMRTEMGSNFPPALNNAINGLRASGATIDGVSATSVNATAMVRNFAQGLVNLGQQRPQPTVTMNDTGFSSIYASAMARVQSLSVQRPTPIAGLEAGPFSNMANWILGRTATIGAQRPSPVATMYADVGHANAMLNWAARNRTVTIWTNTITDRKDGGPVIKAATGRKIVGPGGDREDKVPAVGPGGLRYALSNNEWIVNAMISKRQGDAKMAALNAGLADIVMRDRPVQGFAGGGAPGGINPSSGTGQMVSGGMGPVVINIRGTFDLASSRDLDRAATVIRDRIVNLERAAR